MKQENLVRSGSFLKSHLLTSSSGNFDNDLSWINPDGWMDGGIDDDREVGWLLLLWWVRVDGR